MWTAAVSLIKKSHSFLRSKFYRYVEQMVNFIAKFDRVVDAKKLLFSCFHDSSKDVDLQF